MSGPRLPVNHAQARFECLYGRGCDGVCCREGRPLLYAEEIARLDGALERVLPQLRPEARAAIRRRGYATTRRRLGQRVARNVAGWCVFFNRGCVLHRMGEQEGEKFRYKPAVCALFPIQRNEAGDWYVRQKGYEGEKWDLFCLDPAASERPAAETLQEEIALAQLFDREASKSDPPRST